jgi:hypothetical protein
VNERKRFFLKKEAKIFIFLSKRSPGHAQADQGMMPNYKKFFASFFQERSPFT